mmetsp:Transcript_23526/g.34542  ORF Transcript_23526/g.34542 Transcript_23526/m.34542 type:complete len:137 (+) Transcript_23526:2389-2799(+)
MLHKNESITDLNLSYNPIGNAGALQLIQAVAENSTLTALDVSFNAIDYKGIHDLGASLKTNPFPPNFNLVGVKLATCWQALELPSEAKDWENYQILRLFRKLQDSATVALQDVQLDSVCISSRSGHETKIVTAHFT